MFSCSSCKNMTGEIQLVSHSTLKNRTVLLMIPQLAELTGIHKQGGLCVWQCSDYLSL